MVQAVLSGVILGFCAFLMIVLGVTQIKSKEPVGFYTGEKAPDKEEISDVVMWNRKHGMMWVIYGLIIVLVWVCGLFMGDTIFYLIPFGMGIILPIIVMIFYHHRLIAKYKKR